MIHFNLLLVVDVRVPEAEVFVGPGQFLAVGRPRRSELETFVATGNQLNLTAEFSGEPAADKVQECMLLPFRR